RRRQAGGRITRLPRRALASVLGVDAGQGNQDDDQAVGLRRVDGGTLYWCLTGKPPFPSRGSLPDALARRRTQPPPAIERMDRPDVPAGLRAVVGRLLALRPEDR